MQLLQNFFCCFTSLAHCTKKMNEVSDEEDVLNDSNSSSDTTISAESRKLSDKYWEEVMMHQDEYWSQSLAIFSIHRKESNDKNEIVDGKDPLRHYLYLIVETKVFSFSILTVILINTLFIGIYTSEYIVAKSDWYLTLLENVFLSVYVMELAMKIYVWRLKFFLSTWNVFDFVIVVASLIDFLIPLIVQNTANFNTQVFSVLRVFRAIRALRALRVLRTIRFLKNLQIIVSTVLKSIPAMGSIVLLISLVLYIFAIIGRGLYGEVAPERFGNLAKASFTLFQLITLDDWFFMYSDIRDNYPNHQHILLYLVLFIILETFIFINLFVAVIVDNLARTRTAANTSKRKTTSMHHGISDHTSDVDITERHGKKKAATKRKERTIEEFYLSHNLSKSEMESLGRYWHLLLSLEHHLKANNDRQQTLNELIDLTDIQSVKH